MARGATAWSASPRACIVGAAALAIAAGWVAPVQLCAQSAAPTVEQSYDIPAQPMNMALATFAKASRINIAFESGAVAHLRSAPLRGRYSPAIALSVMLAGRGLTARFTGPASAIVYAESALPQAAASQNGLPAMQLDLAEVRAPMLIGRPNPGGYVDYARRTELELRGMLGDDPANRGRVFRVRIAVRIDPVGRIGQVELVRGSGDRGRDLSLPGTLIGRQLSAPPPAGIEQPLRFDITVNRLGGQG